MSSKLEKIIKDQLEIGEIYTMRTPVGNIYQECLGAEHRRFCVYLGRKDICFMEQNFIDAYIFYSILSNEFTFFMDIDYENGFYLTKI